MEITHKYLIEHHPLADIAVLYQVKPATVRYLASKVEKRQNVLEELQAAEVRQNSKRVAIQDAAIKMDKTTDGILKAQDVIDEVKQTSQMEVNSSLVRKTMRDDLQLRYKPLKRIAFRANSASSLILRKLYAEKLIELMLKGKIVINVDETWINLKNYRRRRWR